MMAMFHLAAWAQSIDPANALTAINAVREEMLFTSGVDLRVPENLAFIVGQAALLNDASAARAQVQSPSLRAFANLDVEPIVAAAVFGAPPESLLHPDSPIAVSPDESLNFAVLSDPAAAALHYGLVWLADRALERITGNIFTVRATSAIAQTTLTWVNGNLTFTQTLPAGRYRIVGMRARSTDAVGARLVFPEQVARPGVPVVNAIGDNDPWAFRYGNMGAFGEFPHTNPPTVDVLGGAAAAQTYLFDLLRVR
jgi:hypothetical protein